MRNLIRPRWQIGILRNPLEDVVNGVELEYDWIESPYRDGWMADPFVLSVSEEEVELLVEDLRYRDGKGRISKVTVDRRTHEITNRKVLLEGGHYSFPAILRKDGKIYVYPEQSQQGKLDLFEYDPETEECKFVGILSEEPLTDAVIYEGMLFSTKLPVPNGRFLYCSEFDGVALKHVALKNQESAANQEFGFEECIARNAGDFFECEGHVYRPAQECNRWYGNALSIQRFEDGKFTEIRRIPGLHTLNSYQGVTVVDRKIFPFKWLFWLLGRSDK